MPFWKFKSKLTGRVFVILRLRPTIDKEEISHVEPTNSLAGHDHSDLPPPSRLLPNAMIGLTSTRADPTIAQSDTSHTGLSDTISSSDNPVYQAHNHQRYETACAHWMTIFHGGQCIAFHPRQGCYCEWRRDLCCWRQFDGLPNRQVKACHALSKLWWIGVDLREIADMLVCFLGLGSPLKLWITTREKIPYSCRASSRRGPYM